MYFTDLKSIYPVKICQNLLFRAKFKGIWQKPGQIYKLREFYHNKPKKLRYYGRTELPLAALGESVEPRKKHQKTYAAMEPWVACNH